MDYSMDKILEKFDVYDLLVRLFTGITVLTCAEFFGIINILHPLSNDKTQLFYYLLIGGYFVGIVLEELLFVISSLIIKHLLKKATQSKDNKTTTMSTEAGTTTGSTKDETTAESTKKGIKKLFSVTLITLTPEEKNKRLKLISAGYEYLLDGPLYQKVMSGSYALAFLFFLILYSLSHTSIYSLAQAAPFNIFIDYFLLCGLTCIFLIRYCHYCHRRKKLINRYYEAYIVLKGKKTQQQED